MATLILSLSLFTLSVSAQVSAAAAPSASLLVTANGECGPGVGMTCLGNPKGGQCCSNAGYCGGDDTYCGTGNCQQGFGLCSPFVTMTNPFATSSILLPSGTISIGAASPSASSMGVVSPDGSCGGLNGYICIGYSAGDCCSNLGFCGSGPQYCMAGCQSSFGMCSNSNSSSVSPVPTSKPSASPWNSMNGTWTSTATVTECDVCDGMTSTGSTKAPTKSTTFPSPYTGNAASAGLTFDVKWWLAAGVAGLLGFL